MHWPLTARRKHKTAQAVKRRPWYHRRRSTGRSSGPSARPRREKSGKHRDAKENKVGASESDSSNTRSVAEYSLTFPNTATFCDSTDGLQCNQPLVRTGPVHLPLCLLCRRPSSMQRDTNLAHSRTTFPQVSIRIGAEATVDRGVAVSCCK
mmetsp:Transcript_9182/g.25658  ORF Transcript_9182/g.25658 Transcript_9182/m.25658 type:complete len:151 (-) Transcript_9182:1494-1946(-)